MIKVLIVDDELLMGSAAQSLLTTMKNIQVVGVVDNGSAAVQLLERYKPDILLVKLPLTVRAEISVDQLLQKPERSPVLIYFPPFAGFSPIPTVVEPAAQCNIRQVSRDDLAAAVLKASKQVLERQEENRAKPRTHLYVYSYLGIDRIPANEILLLQADQKYVKAYMPDSVVTLNDSLVALEDEFRQLFVRIHRNALVAINAIEGLRKIDNRIVIKIRDLSEQPTVSRRRASYLRQLLPLL
jgi:two-component system response regulator AlgR